MLHFNTQSWHYGVVLYVFGKNFFLENDKIDFDASHKTTHIVWIKKPKIINFCPYCRGVLCSVISLPFVYVWRKLPHKEKKELTHEETMKRLKRRGFWIKCIAGLIQFPFAAAKIIQEDYVVGVFQIILGITMILFFVMVPRKNKMFVKIFGPPMEKYVWPPIKFVIAFIAKYWPKKQHKEKNPNIIAAYLSTKHSTICPSVCFIDKVDEEKLR